jgi:hypothetical protein
MLDQKMKDCRCEASMENLQLMQSNWYLLMQRIVTGDETWIRLYDPDTKQESMQWKYATSPSPRKFKVQPSAGKIMCTVFWNAKAVLLIDYMPHNIKRRLQGSTMLTCCVNYASQLKRSAEES